MTNAEAIGRVVSNRRKKLNMSQRDLAIKMSMGPNQRTWVSKVEGGVCIPTIETFCRLAVAMNSCGSEMLKEAEDLAASANDEASAAIRKPRKRPTTVNDPVAIARRRKIAQQLGTIPSEARV
jgi:transcriptional regulator with XRE-family HTH domain